MRTGLLLALLIAGNATASTILTFNVNGISNFAALNQNYGDRVTGASDAVGSYGTNDGIYTPNVLVSYGGSRPALWTTGYGNLTNVYFNDQDGQDLSFTLTADSGFLVTLESFDLAAFFPSLTIPTNALNITDGSGNVLFSVGSLTPSSATRNTLTPQVSASQVVVTIRTSALGTLSDDVAFDNITFSQQVAPTNAVPEPATWTMMAGAVGGLLLLRRRK